MGEPPDTDGPDGGAASPATGEGSASSSDTGPTAPPAEGTEPATDEGAEGAPASGSGPAAVGSVTRSASGTATPSTLVLDVVDLFFQVYPGTTTRNGTNIGIANVSYTVQIGSNPAQTFTTNTDGRARVSIPAGSSATVRIFDTDYVVTSRDTLEAVTTLAGQQRRLQMLGFELGPSGVDGNRGRRTEKAILDFQADANLSIDGIAGSNTRNQLQDPAWVGE